MLTLYYSPGACSLAAHVILEEIGAPFDTVRTPIAEGANQRPEYLALNPRGLVPTLKDGPFVLTESTAILEHLARLFPDVGLISSEPRLAARCRELLSIFSGEV